MAEPVVNGAPVDPNRSAPASLPAPTRDRGGRPELPPEERRTVQLGVRLNAAEAAQLAQLAEAQRMPPATYLRVVGLGTVPPVVPEVNREALAQLPVLAGNVNQIAARLNRGRVGELTGPDRVLLDQVRAALVALQQGLVGRGGAVARQAARFASGAESPVEVFAQLPPELEAERVRQAEARQATRPAVLDAGPDPVRRAALDARDAARAGKPAGRGVRP